MHNQLSTRLIPIMVFLFVFISKGVLAQYNNVSVSNYYQASNYLSLHFATQENEDRNLNNFYQNRYFEPAWLDGNGHLNENALALINYAQQHEYSSLLIKPAFDDLLNTYLQRIEGEGTSLYSTLGTLDIALSKLFLNVAEINLYGLIRPADLKINNWHIPTREKNLFILLEKTALNGSVNQALNKLLPQSNKYYQLKEYLSRYRFIQKQGGWPQVPEIISEIELGDTSEVVKVLKERLIITGDLDAMFYHGLVYDSIVENGVKHFQYRHGLERDGVLGKNTLYNLNITVEERIRQIWVNIEKTKWLPENDTEQYLWVNIPSYQLKYYKNGQLVQKQRIVVGAIKSPTPVFSSHISNIVLNPYWNVPISIAKDEIAPKLTENAQYLLERNYEVLNGWQDQQVVDSAAYLDWKSPSIHRNFRIRQKPGPGNALGILKFNIPNRWSIYLHDTPSKSTFLREKRAYSHGCIRLQEPKKLAHTLLGNLPNSEEEISFKEKLDSKNTLTISLDQNINVTIVYLTTDIDEQGNLMLFEDVYGLDTELDIKLRSAIM